MYLYLYKADALLCLEQVNECAALLKHTIQPLVEVAASPKHPALGGGRRQWPTTARDQELVQCHVQLLNNLAVAFACTGRIAAAIDLLRQSAAQNPDNLRTGFNLCLLLWRQDQKEAACAVWIDARGWRMDLQVDEHQLAQRREEALRQKLWAAQQTLHKAGAALVEDEDGGEEGGGGGGGARQITEHVAWEKDLPTAQVAMLDVLILKHWLQVRELDSIQTSIRYVEYLASIGNNNNKSSSSNTASSMNQRN